MTVSESHRELQANSKYLASDRSKKAFGGNPDLDWAHDHKMRPLFPLNRKNRRHNPIGFNPLTHGK